MNNQFHVPDLASMWTVFLACYGCAGGTGMNKVDTSGFDTATCDTLAAWYRDADGDGFGSVSVSVSACDPPEGYVENSTDCDDLISNIYPGAVEICNDGYPNDCDDMDGVAAATACPSDGPYNPAAGDLFVTGEGEEAGAGASVAGAADVNGDGLSDLLIGAPYWKTGTAYLVLGGITGFHSLSDAQAQYRNSDSVGDGAGWALSNAGDMDGDDLSEVVLGAPYEQPTATGAVFVVSGLLTGAVDLAGADGEVVGESTRSFAGWGVAGLGDVNGDGWDDLLVGAPGVDGPSVESDAGYCSSVDDEGESAGDSVGAGYLVSGPILGTNSLADAEAKLYGEDSADLAGRAVASAGDLNGDGLWDLLIGARGHCAGGYDSGAVYAVLGPVSGTGYLADADGKMVGQGSGSRVGEALSGAGDVDGDGAPDVLIGAPEMDGSATVLQGTVYLMAGPALGTVSVTAAVATFTGESECCQGGHSVSSAGDLDGDGFDDLLIGSMLSGPDYTYPGAAYVFYGPLTGTESLASAPVKFMGAASEAVGWSVAGVGDTNLDGVPDLLIGLFQDDTAYHWAGAAALILGGGPAFDGTWGP